MVEEHKANTLTLARGDTIFLTVRICGNCEPSPDNHIVYNLEPFMHEMFLPIPQDMLGFNPFFGSWICQGDVNIMVDVGPANTAGRLLDAMKASGLERLDYILLTHIHIDHGGALSAVLDRYPTARSSAMKRGFPIWWTLPNYTRGVLTFWEIWRGLTALPRP